MTKIYLVKLFSRGKFFFGNDPLFVEDDGEKGTFYLQKSAFYPQQTTVLGMLQRQLLEQNNLIEIDTNGNEKINDLSEAGQLIGTKSFDANTPSIQDYGIIKKLSPVFIIDKKTDIVLKEKIDVNAEDYTNMRVCFDDEILMNPTLPIVKNNKKEFEYKINGVGKMVFNEEENTHLQQKISYTHYFKKDMPLESGVNKEMQQEDPENIEGFYKNQFAAFDNNPEKEKILGFCCFVELDLAENNVFENAFHIKLGKETNVTNFRMEVSEYAGTPFENPTIDVNTKTIRLLSDAYLTDEVFSFCEGAVSETINFKSINRSVETTIQPWNNEMKNYNLFKRGSVFYLKKNFDVSKLSSLFNRKNYQQIGFNYFITE